MNSQDPQNISPSQLFKQEATNLKREVSTKAIQVPQKISKYKIVKELGKGGMGNVYQAFDSQMNKDIALKIILTTKTKEVQRFVREARALAKMNHPNIVKVYNIGEENGIPFLAMDYIDGLSLKEYLQQKPINARLFSQWMLKIASAVAYAHQKGIIHRDLKPANIMLDDRYEMPYVMDFGLVKLTEPRGANLSNQGDIIGTPQYMSPQQALGKEVNHLVDVYALGAIFYEMLSGQPLVKASNIATAIRKVIHADPVLLRKINSKLSKDLEKICHKAVAKELDQRYQSAEEFGADVKRFLHGELIQARSIGVLERAWHKIYKNRWIVITILVCALIFATVIYMFKNQNFKWKSYLHSAKKWEQKAAEKIEVDKKIELYIQASGLLRKALEVAPSNAFVRQRFFKVQEKMGILATKQKNYLLSYSLFKQCKNLGYKNANRLLNELEEQKKKLKKNHRQFIMNAMKKAMQNTSKTLLDRDVFAIVKMQRSYVVKLLVPYLESKHQNQRILAIRALGRVGDRDSKFKGKDSVVWLLSKLETFKEKKKAYQKEIEEIIWALGWLKDPRANYPVYKLRRSMGVHSPFSEKTKIPYLWIPLEKKALENPTVEQAISRGNIRREKGDYKGSILDYNKALALNPNYPKTYKERGFAYQELKEHYKAISDYSKAIALDPKYLFAYNNRGLVYYNIKEYHKAITDYTKAIVLDPKFPYTYGNRGFVYQALKEHAKAITDFDRAIALNPQFSGAYNNRGRTYASLKKYLKAIADYTQAIAISPKFSEAYVNRALAYINIKQYYKAIADCNQAITITVPSECRKS